jgi:sensor histidine kinase regulating citrate/malate metabolism
VLRRVIWIGMNSGEIARMDGDVATSMVMGIILQIIDTRLLSRCIKQTLSDLEPTIIGACMRVLAALNFFACYVSERSLIL